MRMKKKLVSLALAAVMMASASMPALATSDFSMWVFDERQDTFVYTDEMTGETLALLKSDSSLRTTYFDDGSRITVTPSLMLNDSCDYYSLSFVYCGSLPAEMKSIIIKTGNDRYTFSSLNFSQSTLSDGRIFEEVSFPVKKETRSFMYDLMVHQDEEIKVRINGTYQTFNFTLSDAAKKDIIDLYNLYDMGNGTRKSNLSNITNIDQTVVFKNGQFVDGHATRKVVDALFRGIEYARREQIINALIDSAQ